ncbi:putative bifunctional diguanylate cyclase/phosphodiesterase [Aquihabitans sp. McL0605]|uniref:putative bifunctional diguanylate cyclase/phosphodiesterase n=1 Tax=Aquihabitans sp. McL0605 TaxID=3415671 RepID=UPI003CF62470
MSDAVVVPRIDGAPVEFQLAFEQAPIGIALVSPDGRFMWVNHALTRIVGYTAPELLALTFQDITHPDDLDADLAQVREMIAGEISAYSMEKRYFHAQGHEVPIQLDVSMVRHPNGEPRYFISHVQDITERRATIDALASAHEALRSSQQRFAALVERSTDIICVIDQHGCITYHSPAAERLLGYAHGAWLGTPFTSVVHPDDQAELNEVFRRLVIEPSLTALSEVRVATADGDWRHVEIVATNRLSDPAVSGIVANVRDVTERAEAATRLAWQAFHDSLTGLPNRALLNDRLGHAVDRARRLGDLTALLFLDLDRFKLVNDSMGHEAGDQLLVEVAQRLEGVVRAGDTVARLGGDEFVVLVESVGETEEVIALAQRVGEVVAAPIQLPQGMVTVTASIGIAYDSGRGSEHLLRDADTALYRAKEKGRNRYHVFTESLRTAALRRMTAEQVLRDALEHDRLEVHYQPIIDLADGHLAATEALLRIRGEDGGLELPGEYIEVADESGLIVSVGALVLDRACATLAAWRAEHGGRSPRQMAVNVSARELGAPGFTEQVQAGLDDHGLAPADLVLEFTEATVIGADRATLRAVEWLHKLGVGLSIDDFGTGYSSLAYLKRFPIQSVKLDRTFVAGLGVDPSDAEIVRAVVSLGRSLGLEVIAEGIETLDQLRSLQALGCHYGQGFLLGYPAPGDALHPDAASSPAIVLPPDLATPAPI